MKFNVNIILWVGVAVLLTLQIKSCIEPAKVSEDIIRAKVENEAYKKELPLIRDELVVLSNRYDSLLASSQQRYDNLEKRKQPIYNAIKNIPVIVSNFDKEQLRRALSSY